MTMELNEGEGFPSEWFNENAIEYLKCGICLGVLNNPHGCKNDHHFCYKCILIALESSRTCPSCGIALKRQTLVKSTTIRSIIESLPEKCDEQNGKHICRWNGTVQTVSQHPQHCPNKLIRCPLFDTQSCVPSCSGVILRGDWPTHLQQIDVTKFESMPDAPPSSTQRSSPFAGIMTQRIKPTVVFTGTKPHPTTGIHSGTTVDEGENPNEVYCGEFRNFQAHGHGTCNYTDGAVYVGEWKDDACSGRGKLTERNGDVFEGNFENNKLHGRGTHRTHFGDVFEGEWVNGAQTGEGSQHFADGNIFKGTFLEDKPHGYCESSQPDGITYAGEWLHGLRHGQGAEHKPLWYNYDGEWVEGKFSGHGVQTYIDCSVYEGEFLGGKYEGQGTLTNSMWEHSGAFRKDLVNGCGVRRYVSGKVLEGYFKHNIYLGIR